MDLVADVTWTGRRFRILVVLDVFSRSAWRCWSRRPLGGSRVTRVLDEPVALRGKSCAVYARAVAGRPASVLTKLAAARLQAGVSTAAPGDSEDCCRCNVR